MCGPLSENLLSPSSGVVFTQESGKPFTLPGLQWELKFKKKERMWSGTEMFSLMQVRCAWAHVDKWMEAQQGGKRWRGKRWVWPNTKMYYTVSLSVPTIWMGEAREDKSDIAVKVSGGRRARGAPRYGQLLEKGQIRQDALNSCWLSSTREGQKSAPDYLWSEWVNLLLIFFWNYF